MRTSVDVHNHLVERNIPHELVALPGRLRSAERIAAVLDLPPEHVGKVVIYEAEPGPVVALVAADRDADPAWVCRALGVDRVQPVGPSRASQLSEYLHDAIPPVGLPEAFSVVMDLPLASMEVLYFAAGDAAAILKIRGRDLVAAADATVAPIGS